MAKAKKGDQQHLFSPWTGSRFVSCLRLITTRQKALEINWQVPLGEGLLGCCSLLSLDLHFLEISAIRESLFLRSHVFEKYTSSLRCIL